MTVHSLYELIPPDLIVLLVVGLVTYLIDPK